MNDEVTNGERKIDFLAQLPLFEGVPTAAHEALSRIAIEFEFQRGAIIAHQGDVASQLYIVRAGQLETFVRDADQGYVKQATYSAGDWFNDYWLFEQGLYPATVRARRAGRLITIPSSAFLSFVKAHPSALNGMYPYLSVAAQDAIVHSRFQAYLRPGVRRRIGERDTITAAPRVRETPSAEGGEQFEEFRPDAQQVRRYAKFQLLPEEVVYFEARRSRKIMGFKATVAMIVAIFLFAIPIILLGTSGITGTIMLVTGGILALFPLFSGLLAYINWLTCYFLVTNKRLIRYENKIFSFKSQVEKIDIDNVQSVATEKQGFIANWLNIGTAVITTAAQTHVLYFDFIDNPQEVENSIKRITSLKRTIGQSQHRAALRRTVEGYFQVPASVSPVGSLPTSSARRGNLSQWLRETFGRSERDGAIVYHKHPIAIVRPMLSPVLIALVLLLVYLVVAFFTPSLMSLPIVWGTLLILGLLDAAWVLWVIEDWRNDTFMITNQYIFDIDRLPLGLNESRKQAELTKIENVRAEQNGLLPNLFKYGHVHIDTAGADSNLVFENVRHPDKIQNEIFARRDILRVKLVRQEEERKQKDYAMLIDLYYQSVQQGRIPGHQPLPAIDDVDDEADDNTPLVL